MGQSCSLLKGPFYYEICIGKPADTSNIIRNVKIGIADTSLAFLSGQVIEKDTKEPILFCNVILTKTNSNEIYFVATDENGRYSIKIPSGDYNLKINYIGRLDIISGLTLRNGEMREIDASIGHGASFVTYMIESTKRLNKKQLSEKTEQLRNEN
jgi:hypothetical protein